MKAATAVASLFAAALLASAAAAPGQGKSRTQAVHFAPGKRAVTIPGAISGDESVDYVVTAAAGQQMTVTLKSANPNAYFNAIPPGSAETIFDGSASGNAWSGALTRDGEYALRVALKHPAGGRDETAKFTLEIGISGGRAEK